MSAAAREVRIGEVIGAVARQALADRGARRVALLDDGGPESAFAARILARALGDGAVVRVTADPADADAHRGGAADGARVAEELRRMRARLVPDAVPAHAATKTVLLLGGELPPEPLLPLGDLWATEVAEMAGGWSAPPAVARIADGAGGMAALDAALAAYFDRRDPRGLDALPADARQAVAAALAAGRASRRWPRTVPRLGVRTLCVDLFE